MNTFSMDEAKKALRDKLKPKKSKPKETKSFQSTPKPHNWLNDLFNQGDK